MELNVLNTYSTLRFSLVKAINTYLRLIIRVVWKNFNLKCILNEFAIQNLSLIYI